MRSNLVKIFTVASLVISASSFAAGTFSCAGDGVTLNGVFSSAGTSLKFIKIEGEAQGDAKALRDNSAAYLNSSRFVADATLGKDSHIIAIEINTVGAPAEGDMEPNVYGGILRTTRFREPAVEGDKQVEITKAVAITCSASY